VPSFLPYVLVAGASASTLTLMVRIIDDKVRASIDQHVTAALGEPPAESTFDTHVAQALNVVFASTVATGATAQVYNSFSTGYLDVMDIGSTTTPPAS
jgi:hypothetical protein